MFFLGKLFFLNYFKSIYNDNNGGLGNCDGMDCILVI